jgi:transposase
VLSEGYILSGLLRGRFTRLRKALEKELAELDRLISDYMRRSTINGLGGEGETAGVRAGGQKTIARTLITELRELGSLDRRRIAALVGLVTLPPGCPHS